MAKRWTQDPDAVLDYTLDWTALLVAGDSVTATDFTTSPPDLSVLSQNNDGPLATVWLWQGNTGVTYNVTCHITTAGGRQDDRTFKLFLKEK